MKQRKTISIPYKATLFSESQPFSKYFSNSSASFYENAAEIPLLSQISHKDRKFFDRQALLLLGLLERTLENVSGIDKSSSALNFCVGPARTDLESMLKWASRISDDPMLPAVQPAFAVGLLPNSALSLASIQMNWTGEGNVWSGFAECGAGAIASACDYFSIKSRKAVVAAVNCTNNYFVHDTLEKTPGKRIDNQSELAVSVVLGDESAECSLCGVLSASCFSDLQKEAEIYWEISLPSESLIKPKIEPFGDCGPALFPFVMFCAQAGIFADGDVPFYWQDHFQRWHGILIRKVRKSINEKMKAES
ncbi:MAG: hypothetical protein HQM10_22470 [Candidatus Riflebacteria bacterium]|nr:hypothetical protein [Candidatus Riflebacteria bacterium]